MCGYRLSKGVDFPAIWSSTVALAGATIVPESCVLRNEPKCGTGAAANGLLRRGSNKNAQNCGRTQPESGGIAPVASGRKQFTQVMKHERSSCLVVVDLVVPTGQRNKLDQRLALGKLGRGRMTVDGVRIAV